MSWFNSSKPFIISPVLFLIPCTFGVPNHIVLLHSLCRRTLYLSRAFLMGFFSNLPLFLMSRGLLACCINPQPGGPHDFRSRFSSSSPWYASIELQGSSASFGPPQVFYFPGTHLIWWASPYPPPGEAPDGRLATPNFVAVWEFPSEP